MSRQGLRVIAVGRMIINSADDIPSTHMECKLELLGLI